MQVTDIARGVRFYGAVFGWTATRPDSSYALLDAGPVAVGLSLVDSVDVGGPVMVVKVFDLEAVLAKVTQSGGVIRQTIRASWRGRQFRFADPDGNEVIVWSDVIVATPG